MVAGLGKGVMRVRAKRLGYHGLCTRQEGEIFEFETTLEKLPEKSWMEKVDGKAKPRVEASEEFEEPRGARPSPEDASARADRIAKVDKMAKEAMRVDKKNADVI